VFVCPRVASGTTSATIDANGGLLSFAGHSVRIPAGAVSEPTHFTFSVSGHRGLRVEVVADGGVPRIEQPLELTISYAECPRQDFRRRTFRVLGLGGDGSPPSIISPEIHVTAQTLTFAALRSVYVVAY
jgi:hypothetical protein